MKKDDKIPQISTEFKEALATLGGRPEFHKFVEFLKVQQNNIAIIEWFRLKSADPELSRRKAYYEGEFDIIKYILSTFEMVKKGDK